jgi:hypothetical protein
MPQFTQWNVPDPFPNILYNPAAVDAAIAKTQSELGNLDIERKKFGLERQKFDRGVTEGEGYIGGSLSGTAGTPGATVGPLADAAPDQSRDAAGQASYAFWLGKGLAPHQAAGMAAQEVAESGGRPHVKGDGGDAFGLYQHHPDRRALILARAGIDMNKPDANTQREGAYWELMNVEHGARKLLFASKDPDEAGRAATEFERPDSKRRHIIDAERGRDARRIFMLANPNGAASVATASVDPRAGPRVGLTPAPAVAAAPGVNPNAAVQIPPPVTTGQADDPNTAAVKQASAALLNMPEPDAAAAYPAVVRELQARGFAMNAPPEYPGHAALQALVGGGDVAAPAVEPSRMAMRLGGTDTAGPGAGQATVPPDVQPNRMAYGTGLPGVTINAPGNPLAPPPVQTAAAPAQAQPQATSPQTQPPPAPSRAIQREPLLSNNLTASQQDAARRAIRAGTPLATVQAHVEQWKQENVAARHQDAVDAAAQQQQDYDRRRQFQQDTRQRENDQVAAQKAAEDRVQREIENKRADTSARLSAAANAREAAKAHEENLNNLTPKIEDGTATPAEKRLYAGSYYALQQQGATATTMDDPNNPGQKIPAMITRRLPKNFPEPEGGALPLVMSSPGAPTKAPMTDTQAGAASYADRMSAAEPIMRNLESSVVTLMQKGLERVGDFTGYNVNSKEYEKLRTAQEAFLVGILRKESGAAVSASEWERYGKMYFPQPGNDAETIELKRQFRQAAIDGMIREAGPGYKPAAGASPASTTSAPASDAIAAARDAITKGAPRDAVIKRLRDNGIDPGGL